MKRTKGIETIHYVVFFIMLIPFLSLAQEYLPFPTDSAVWYTVKSWPEYDPPPPVWYTTYKYETNGDTIINGVEYTKLYSNSVPASLPYYEGAYRVDIENERVYFVDALYGTESLLYDFGLVPGDTIMIELDGAGEPFTLVCIDTSTMIINNAAHHSFFIHSYYTNGAECYTTWVKGIGSLRMPIETDWFCAAWFEGKYDLSCFYYKEEHIYEWIENPYFEGCIGNNVGIEEYPDNNYFTIAPNPVSGISGIISNTDGKTLFDYWIYDVNGKMIQNGTNIVVDDFYIQKSQYKNGLYVLRLYAHNLERFYSIKFIINL